MLQIIGIVSGLLATIGLVPYLVDIFRGKTKPERASWIIWTVLGAIAFFSQLAQGARNSLWMTGFQLFNVALITLLSLKYGYGSFSKRDVCALMLAGCGLLLWKITTNPLLALIVVVCVDFIGVYLTLIKTLKYPDSETLVAWFLASLSGLLGLIAVGKLDFGLLVYPFYIFGANTAITWAIWKGRAKK